MSARFNVSMLLLSATSSSIRSVLVKATEEIFSEYLSPLRQIALLDVQSNKQATESWSESSRLLQHELTANEILFVYGGQRMKGTENLDSISFSESHKWVEATVSLRKTEAMREGIPGMEENIMKLFAKGSGLADCIVGAGLEFDFEHTHESIMDALVFSMYPGSLATWIAVSTAHLTGIELDSVEVKAFDHNVLLFNRKTWIEHADEP